MNLSSKCSQLLKLLNGNSSYYRTFKVCTRTTIPNKTRLRLFEGRINNKRVNSFPTLQRECESLRWRNFYTSSSRSSQKNVDKSQEKEKEVPVTPGEEFANLGLIARFKKMYKEYWYVLVPVHLATSAVWFGSFYYASKR